MATEYGYRASTHDLDVWSDDSGLFDRDAAEWYAHKFEGILIAREVSEPRIVSIRA